MGWRRKYSSCGLDEATTPSPNQPDPSNFEVLSAKEFVRKNFEHEKRAVVARVRYPDATNYEGEKIMVYSCGIKKFEKQKSLDPHFCEHADCLSPVARFEPTQRGWHLAVSLALVMVGALPDK